MLKNDKKWFTWCRTNFLRRISEKWIHVIPKIFHELRKSCEIYPSCFPRAQFVLRILISQLHAVCPARFILPCWFSLVIFAENLRFPIWWKLEQCRKTCEIFVEITRDNVRDHLLHFSWWHFFVFRLSYRQCTLSWRRNPGSKGFFLSTRDFLNHLRIFWGKNDFIHLHFSFPRWSKKS